MAMSRLASVPARDPALEGQLERGLAGAPLGRPVYAFPCVGSTMEIAHALAHDSAAEGTLVWALRQERGRGRLGRAWESPEGGVYGSLILRPKRPTAAPQLSLVTGLAAAEAIRDLACLYASIRWPNDLLLGGRKAGGILVEARGRAVVVGVGINVTTEVGRLPLSATSLVAEGASHCSLPDVLAGLCRRLNHWYDVWTAEGFPPIREALRPWMGHFGQVVHVTAGTTELQGTAQDLDEQGRLVVRLESGLLRAFEVGEVALLR